MTDSIKLTIDTILNLKSGRVIESKNLLADSDEEKLFVLRTKIETGIQTGSLEYVCIYCKQPVKLIGRRLLGHRAKTLYFSHLYNSDDCIIKTTSRLTTEQIRCIKYNGEKESKLHENLKLKIAHFLMQDSSVDNVVIEKIYKDKRISDQWKKPDVMARFEHKTIAFELQLSTTFLSVIVSRSIFYQAHGVFLIWIFPHFSLNSDIQKFTQKDVYYNNSFNVYVFDHDCESRSETKGKLILKCFYKEFSIIGEEIKSDWLFDYISLDKLTFVKISSKVFYKNADEQKKGLKKELERRKQNIIEKRFEDRIEKAVNYIRMYYRYDTDPIPDPEFMPLNFLKTEREIEELNKRISFDKNNAHMLEKLILNGQKNRFLRFLSKQDIIRIDLSNSLVDGKTPISRLLYKEDIHGFRYIISQFFELGYTVRKADEETIQYLYDKNYANVTENEKDAINKWAYLYILCKLKTNRNMEIALGIESVLNAILSLKHNMIIHSGYENMRSVVMLVLDKYKEYGTIFLRALKYFGEYDRQLLLDKNGKFKKKIEAIDQMQENNSFPNQAIIFKLFPELDDQQLRDFI